MRNSNNGAPGNRRMMNQLSRAMERRPDDRDALHRIRPQGDRIDKNNKFNNAPRGPMGNRGNLNRFNNNRGGPQNRMNGRNNNNFGMPGFNGNMTPEQQMQFYQMFQQQAQMMTPFMGGPPPPMPLNNGGMRGGRGNHMGNNGFNMAHHGGNGPHGGRGGFQNQNFQHHRNHNQNNNNNGSLFERIQAPPDLSQPPPDEAMNDDHPNADENMGDTASTTSKHNSKPEEVPCKFGTGCTKAECIFGHPTPAAPHNRGILYVSGERCPFGTSCKNRKCTGSHPSPAAVPNFHSGGGAKKIDQDCKFFPNCTNPNCPFRQYASPFLPAVDVFGILTCVL